MSLDYLKSDTRNTAVLADFVRYCQEHPHERFWQALRNWSGYRFILAVGKPDEGAVMHEGAEIRIGNYDTFSFEGRRHDDR